jgi:hypothetical protein
MSAILAQFVGQWHTFGGTVGGQGDCGDPNPSLGASLSLWGQGASRLARHPRNSSNTGTE